MGSPNSGIAGENRAKGSGRVEVIETIEKTVEKNW
jgi:hypothetical protein